MSGGAGPVDVVVSGFAVHVPGASDDDLLGAVADSAEMVPAEDAKSLLGRKGTLYKEPASLLAMCAVQRAWGLPPGRPEKPVRDAAGTAVVVSSNLGNAHTVCDMTARVDAESCREVSPLEAPNASSNVIAGAIAIRFGFTGPNLTVCNGATSGIDAVRLGARLVRAGRAERVVVVGVEPADETAASLYELRDPAAFDGHGRAAPRAGAACVVLSAEPSADRVRIGSVGVVAPGRPEEALAAVTGRVLDGPGCLLLAPYGLPGDGEAPYDVVDLTSRLGETYGALGVIQVACAAGGRPRPRRALAVSGDRVDGYAWLELRGPR